METKPKYQSGQQVRLVSPDKIQYDWALGDFYNCVGEIKRITRHEEFWVYNVQFPMDKNGKKRSICLGVHGDDLLPASALINEDFLYVLPKFDLEM